MLKPPLSFVVAGACAMLTIFASVPAVVLTSASYHVLKRGDFRSTARDGTVQIFSAAATPQEFWPYAIGLSGVAALVLFVAVVSGVTSIYITLRSAKLIRNVRNI